MTPRTPEEWAKKAVFVADSIEQMEKEIASLKEVKADCIRHAVEGGVKAQDGFVFSARSPSSSVSTVRFAEEYPDLYKAYIDYARKTYEVPVTVTAIKKYLQTADAVKTEPSLYEDRGEAVLQSITDAGDGDVTYVMRREKR